MFRDEESRTRKELKKIDLALTLVESHQAAPFSLLCLSRLLSALWQATFFSRPLSFGPPSLGLCMALGCQSSDSVPALDHLTAPADSSIHVL